MTAYIVDNSVWWKANRFPGIAKRLREVGTGDLILTCPPQALEYCQSAPTPAKHIEFQQDMAVYFPVDEHPSIDLVLRIQEALWTGGFFRAVGVVDILIAGYAIANDATVLTADLDFDHIARVIPELRHEYLPEV